jgi:hypothetical protein
MQNPSNHRLSCRSRLRPRSRPRPWVWRMGRSCDGGSPSRARSRGGAVRGSALETKLVSHPLLDWLGLPNTIDNLRAELRQAGLAAVLTPARRHRHRARQARFTAAVHRCVDRRPDRGDWLGSTLTERARVAAKGRLAHFPPARTVALLEREHALMSTLNPNPLGILRMLRVKSATIAWSGSGLPRSLHTSGKRDGDPTPTSLCMDMPKGRGTDRITLGIASGTPGTAAW